MQLSDIDFLIIGAAKSATTWLQQSLQQNPSVYMPDPELHFFSRNFEKGDGWYLGQFSPKPGQSIVGEKSNSYLDEPEAAARIRKALPRARLIAQLRNPVDRAYSDYCMLYRRGEVGTDITRYLDPRLAKGGRFLVSGFYCSQLEAYLDLFPAENLQVLLYEHMRQNPQAHLDTVRDFLQLSLPLHPVVNKVKDKTVPVVPPKLRRLLQPLKPIAAPLRRNPIVKGLRSMVARELDYVPLPTDLRNRLVEFYAPETERLGALLKQDLRLAAGGRR
ncbi:heparan sulfate glucosamine 3-O-sulfotransferase [Ensifer adhaerens]|nr:heparan sulfate glucosamine 3-O-sulfotransferase [Ensifer adhaerens]